MIITAVDFALPVAAVFAVTTLGVSSLCSECC